LFQVTRCRWITFQLLCLVCVCILRCCTFGYVTAHLRLRLRCRFGRTAFVCCILRLHVCVCALLRLRLFTCTVAFRGCICTYVARVPVGYTRYRCYTRVVHTFAVYYVHLPHSFTVLTFISLCYTLFTCRFVLRWFLFKFVVRLLFTYILGCCVLHYPYFVIRYLRYVPLRCSPLYVLLVGLQFFTTTLLLFIHLRLFVRYVCSHLLRCYVTYVWFTAFTLLRCYYIVCCGCHIWLRLRLYLLDVGLRSAVLRLLFGSFYVCCYVFTHTRYLRVYISTHVYTAFLRCLRCAFCCVTFTVAVVTHLFCCWVTFCVVYVCYVVTHSFTDSRLFTLRLGWLRCCYTFVVGSTLRTFATFTFDYRFNFRCTVLVFDSLRYAFTTGPPPVTLPHRTTRFYVAHGHVTFVTLRFTHTRTFCSLALPFGSYVYCLPFCDLVVYVRCAVPPRIYTFVHVYAHWVCTFTHICTVAVYVPFALRVGPFVYTCVLPRTLHVHVAVVTHLRVCSRLFAIRYAHARLPARCWLHLRFTFTRLLFGSCLQFPLPLYCTFYIYDTLLPVVGYSYCLTAFFVAPFVHDHYRCCCCLHWLFTTLRYLRLYYNYILLYLTLVFPTFCYSSPLLFRL